MRHFYCFIQQYAKTVDTASVNFTSLLINLLALDNVADLISLCIDAYLNLRTRIK